MGNCQAWCDIEDLCCDKVKYTTGQLERAILGASEDLSRWSYNQFGVCEYKIQPGVKGCEPVRYDKTNGTYALVAQIPADVPIESVTKIVEYDENKNPTDLDITDIWWEYNTIFFPPDFVFPTQTPGPIGGRNTWHIELKAGNPIPKAGVDAAIVLAQKKLEDLCVDDCKPDPRMKTIVRQGAEWTFQASDQQYKAIPAVAHFISLYGGARRWSGIVTPQNMGSQLVE